MFDSGGIQDEVRWLLGRGLDRAAIGACGIGYSEALDLIEGHIDLEAAMQATMRRTLRYARAQRTWFRRDTRLTWFRPDLISFDQLLSEVLDLVAAAEAGPTMGDDGALAQNIRLHFSGSRATFRVAQAGWRMFQSNA